MFIVDKNVVVYLRSFIDIREKNIVNEVIQASLYSKIKIKRLIFFVTFCHLKIFMDYRSLKLQTRKLAYI
jgi:hypothetical protein